jgi:hypothetical protein
LVETCSPNTSYDTVLYVRSGAPNGPEIACNDDTPGCAIEDGAGSASRKGSRVTFPVTAGATYYVVVDGYARTPTTQEESFELRVVPGP